MTEIITNTWIKIADDCKPWKGREVLVRLEGGKKVTLTWNGYYWTDPIQGKRVFFHPHETPTHFYIFEKFKETNE